ncbi:hypothetical protein ABMA27_003273 [Loxostege sticticalis]|uniref:Fucosyltransferase n=1 Tax=Loxostege sticticalis TaxID=481309 RepID=A0ABR3HSJ4_LOXSC
MYIALKTEAFAKLFFLVSCAGLVMYGILAFYTFHTAYTTVVDLEKYNQNFPLFEGYKGDRFYTDLKYILVWTTPEYFQNPLGEGQAPFVKYDCPFYNCYLSTKKDLLNGDYKNFDAVFMDIGFLRKWKKMALPRVRSPAQKYIFHSMRSSDETPICTINSDNYFNWTWTYKLSSDIVTPFIEVRDLEGNRISPRLTVRWKSNMTKLSQKDKERMNTKKKAVAWVMNSCRTRTNRMVFVKSLRNALREHSLELDIYGCKMLPCPNDDCRKLLERDYYYSLVYESSHAEDYVTDEVLKAYHHDVVPIVKGGANYQRFLPEGSYLNAENTTVQKLAAHIDYSIRNLDVYYDYHRWRNHYTIKKFDYWQGLCQLCELLHSRASLETFSSYEKFRSWWYTDTLKDRCYPKGAENMVDVLSYMDSKNKVNKTVVTN